MTITEVARIYKVDVDVIRLLEKRGIIQVERIYDGGMYDPRYKHRDSDYFRFGNSAHFRRNVDPDELEVLEMLIDDMHSGRCREWTEVPRSRYQGYDSLYDFIQSELHKKLELEILAELL